MGELLSLPFDLSSFPSWQLSVSSCTVLGFVFLLLCFSSSFSSCCFFLSPLSLDCLAGVVLVGLVVASIPILLMKS